MEAKPRKWMQDLSIESLNWEEKEWENNLRGTTLKRIKPWMWKRNIRAMLDNS